MTQLPIANAQELAEGQIILVRLTDEIPAFAIILRKEGNLRAYLNICRHLPIPLGFIGDRLADAAKTHLICSTHGARYRMIDGYCDDGPCEGKSLYPIEISQQNGKFFLEVTERILKLARQAMGEYDEEEEYDEVD